MKKLLGIFTVFGITMSSSLSIIACEKKSDDQAAIDKAIEALKDKTLTISATDGNETTVTQAIKDNTDFKTKLADSEIKIESMKFTAAGTDFTGTFVNYTEYGVKLSISKKEAKKTSVNFKIKINILSDKDLIVKEKAKLDAIKADSTSVKMNLTGIDIAKLIDQIKKESFYTNIIKDKITLDGNLALAKDVNKTAINDNELINNATVFVLGKIKINQETADFKFSIKLVNTVVAKKDLSGLTNPPITSAATTSAFTTALITALATGAFSGLTNADIDIKKSDNNVLQDTDITGNPIAVKITAKASSSNFIGTKVLNVDWTITP